MPTILPLSDSRATLDLVGGKGASLSKLAGAGLPVPGGFIVTTAAYRKFAAVNGLQEQITRALESRDLSDPQAVEAAAKEIQAAFLDAPLGAELEEEICAAYASFPSADKAVAVRSSATAEDLPEASFAGQQDTYLNIRGAEAVLDAVRRCFASLWTARAIAYRARQGIDPAQVALAVVVQELVDAEAAGILFTADPLSGDRARMLVNSAWGLGEAVVGGLVTPDTYTLDKTGGRVIKSQLAEKQLMTVRVDGGTVEVPVPAEKRSAPSLDDQALSELTRMGVQIEELFGTPMDIEWALAEGKVHLLQARPITTLPAPAAEEIIWKVPDPKGHWMRGSFIDFMPDPLTTLFESMLLPTYHVAMPKLMENFKMSGIEIYSDYLYVFNHFPYIKVSYSMRQWLQLLFRLPPAIKPFIARSLPLWQEEILPHYRQISKFWQGADLRGRQAAAILNGVDEIFQAAMDHLTAIQVATLGSAAGTETLFTTVYNKLIKREGDPAAPVFVMGYASKPIRAEQALFDLARWCQERPALGEYLKSAAAKEIIEHTLTGHAPAGVTAESWGSWTRELAGYLVEYGYAIYNMDFGRAIPSDDPTPILESLRLSLNGVGKDPYQRQQAAERAREEATRSTAARLKGIKAWLFRKTLGWAQKFAPLREDSIAEVGAGYPAIRRLLRELGRRLSAKGSLREQGDIFWLTRAELQGAVEALDANRAPGDFSAAAAARKAEWERLSRLTPPSQLPAKKKVLGIDAEMFSGVTGENENENTLRGIAASPGSASGTARVLSVPEDFAQMRPGDVLVAPFTTPAWTPLFAMASAVVTDIGGPLSHGSIVAREYGIPAVLGTRVATQRIRSGQNVTVDGGKGIVTIHQN